MSVVSRSSVMKGVPLDLEYTYGTEQGCIGE